MDLNDFRDNLANALTQLEPTPHGPRSDLLQHISNQEIIFGVECWLMGVRFAADPELLPDIDAIIEEVLRQYELSDLTTGNLSLPREEIIK